MSIAILLFIVFLNTEDSLKEWTLKEIQVNAPFPFFKGEEIERKVLLESGGFFEGFLTFSSFDLFIRNPFGIQSDISINGSSFEQNLVLFDGIKINDPQTAHHNQDIPVPLIAIQNGIILKGGENTLWSPDALGGSILYKTKDEPENRIKIGGGNFDFKEISGITGITRKRTKFWVAGEYISSNGFIKDRDFKKYNFAGKIALPFGKNNFSILTGYGEKAFGALNFYAPFPSFEKTNSLISLANFSIPLNKALFSLSFSIKTHIDSFVLVRENPDFYANKHNKNTYGVRGIFIFGNIFSSGFESILEKINSTRLGNRTRKSFSLFSGAEKKLDILSIRIGTRWNFYILSKSSQNFFIPYFSLSFPVLSSELYLSARRNERLPSFTELYYYDPKNKGDSLLLPEESYEIETGIIRNFHIFTFNLRGFMRTDRNLIEWIKKQEDSLWFWDAENISKRNIYGGEMNVLLTGSFYRIKIGWTKQNWANGEKDIETKYATRIFKDKLAGSVRIEKFAHILLWGFYRIRKEENNAGLLNLSILFPIFKKPEILTGLRIYNLLNNYYEDFKDVPYPPRWIQGIFEMKI